MPSACGGYIANAFISFYVPRSHCWQNSHVYVMPSLFESQKQEEEAVGFEIELLEETTPLLEKRHDLSNDISPSGRLRKLNLCTLYSSDRRACLIFIAILSAILFIHLRDRSTSAVAMDACILKSSPANAGYDVVAYYSLEPYPEGTAVLGSEEFTSNYFDYTYHFSTASNKAKFEANPIKYLPIWGGFCAYAITSESWWTWEEIEEDGPAANPNVWLIYNDKLHLFMLPDAKKAFENETADSNLDYAGSLRWASWTNNIDLLHPNNFIANTGCFWYDLQCGQGSIKSKITGECILSDSARSKQNDNSAS